MTDDEPPSDPDESSEDDPTSPAGPDRGPAAVGDAIAAGSDDETAVGEAVFSDLRRKLTLAAVGILALLAAVAVYRAYAATSRAIGIWFSRDFVPIFAAVFNVFVVLVAVAAIFYLVRRVS